MARSNVEHFAMLNRWPIVMQESPWHFNQLVGTLSPLTQPCDEVYIQDERDDIANGLNLAVVLVSEALGFYPRPVWLTERLPLGHGTPLELQQLQTSWGYVEEFSIRTQTLVLANVPVVYNLVAGTATFTLATTVAADELRVYFQTVDGAEAAGDTDWEIEPLTVTSTGIAATFTGPASLFASPDIVWANPREAPNYLNKLPFDADDVTHYVAEVDVYRVYGETTGAVRLLTDPLWDSSVANSDDIAENAVGRILDSRLGLFQVRLNDCVDLANCTYYPTEVWVSYKAGYPLRAGKMDRQLEWQLTRIANVKIPYKPDTNCGERNNTMWQTDSDYLSKASPTASPPPWGGMTIGEWDAWNMLKRLRIGHGGKVTARSG